jgi:hypothetical protein
MAQDLLFNRLGELSGQWSMANQDAGINARQPLPSRKRRRRWINLVPLPVDQFKDTGVLTNNVQRILHAGVKAPMYFRNEDL